MTHKRLLVRSLRKPSVVTSSIAEVFASLMSNLHCHCKAVDKPAISMDSGSLPPANKVGLIPTPAGTLLASRVSAFDRLRSPRCRLVSKTWNAVVKTLPVQLQGVSRAQLSPSAMSISYMEDNYPSFHDVLVKLANFKTLKHISIALRPTPP